MSLAGAGKARRAARLIRPVVPLRFLRDPGVPRSSLHLLLGFVRPHWLPLMAAALASLLMSASSVLGLRLVEEITRSLTAGPGHWPLPQLAAAALALAGVVSALAFAQHWWAAATALRLGSTVRQAAFSQLLSSSWGWLQRQRVGELLNRLGNDVLLLQNGVERLLPRLLRMLLLPIGVIGYLLYISLPLTLVTLVLVALAAGLMAMIGRSARRRGHRSASSYDTLGAALHETLRNRYTVKCLAAEEFERERLRRTESRYLQRQRERIRIEGLYRPATALLQLGCLLGLLLFGGHLVTSGMLGVDQLTAYFAGLGVLVSNFSALGGIQGELQQSIVALERLGELLAPTEPERDAPYALDMPPGIPGVRFERVSFRYREGDTEGLHEVDLDIPAGELTAIVGPSGAGKTTLLNLLLRLYAPQSGRILVGGLDIAAARLAALRAHIGIVPQQPELFAGTVSENIAYGVSDAGAEQIRQAAQAAQAEEFILQLPGGYASMLQEGASNLSAGERQRIAIARAFLRSPPLLLMDEPTANLDTHSEQRIAAALQRLRQHRTIIMVAHRLAAARTADRIVVMQHGRVVETGTPADLLLLGGHYARLYYAHVGGG